MKKVFSVLVLVSLSLACFVAVFPSPKAYAQPVSSCDQFGSQISYTLPGSYGKDIMLCAYASQEIGGGNTITSLMWVGSSLQPTPSYWTNLVLTLKDGGSKVGREDLPRGEQDHAEGETNIHEGV